MSRKKTDTTNTPADSTAAYLAQLGLSEADIPTADTVTSIAYAGGDAMAWEGETYERLKGEFDFYRATKSHEAVSLKAATAEGYVAIPAGHDARMANCHDPENEVIMIRRKDLSKRVHEQREQRRAAKHRRRQGGATDRAGTQFTTYEQREFNAEFRSDG